MGQTEVTSLMKGINHPSLELFRKDKYLGRGGFGHVWKVLYCKGDYYLAMKQLSKIEIYKQNFISNIFEEREILNILYNVHIVNLYLTFQDENYIYLIMDYLEGGDLRKHMKEKKFNINEIKFVSACIIIGLEYIHRKGIIHRDIKPENLIFDEKGYLRLSDFGIAIRNDKISANDKYNDKSGTPGYMSPERIINDKNISYTYSSDFFSLGVILYELTMLKKPFRKNNDKIGRERYTSYEEIIHDLFNNEPININPLLVKSYRNYDNNNGKNDNLDNEELTNLCDLINKLLVYEQKDRLGYHNINDIKKHPFFGERFEWKKIYHRSFKSPFNTYEFYFKSKPSEKKGNNEKDLMNNIKMEKLQFTSDEEKNNFQNKFKDFTSIHKITKEDFNYFYLKGDNCGTISKYRNDSYSINKYSNSNKKRKIIKNTLTCFPKKNQKFLSQSKYEKEKNHKFKIIPNKLFKENNNKDNINKISSPGLLKIKISPEKVGIPVGVIKENIMNKFFNKTNLNFFKINNLKNNIINKMNNYLPIIHSSRINSKSLLKPTSATLSKNRHSNSIDNYKKNTKILLGKNLFKSSCFNLINQKDKKNIKRKDEHCNTDSNNKKRNIIQTNIKKYKKYSLLKKNGEKIINELYQEKINELNKDNLDREIKEIILQ